VGILWTNVLFYVCFVRKPMDYYKKHLQYLILKEDIEGVNKVHSYSFTYHTRMMDIRIAWYSERNNNVSYFLLLPCSVFP